MHMQRNELGQFAGGRRTVWTSGYVWIRTRTGWRAEHIVKWERYRGPVPKGHIVHHKDDNKENNKLSNLQLMSRAEHQRHHHLGTGVKRFCKDCNKQISRLRTALRCKSCGIREWWRLRKAA